MGKTIRSQSPQVAGKLRLRQFARSFNLAKIPMLVRLFRKGTPEGGTKDMSIDAR
jgi:hypothetical protein